MSNYNDFQFRVNRAASAASYYKKNNYYETMGECIRAAARSLGVNTKSVAQECRRRYNIVKNKNARRYS